MSENRPTQINISSENFSAKIKYYYLHEFYFTPRYSFSISLFTLISMLIYEIPEISSVFQ